MESEVSGVWGAVWGLQGSGDRSRWWRQGWFWEETRILSGVGGSTRGPVLLGAGSVTSMASFP